MRRSSGRSTSAAPTTAACTAANRFIVAVSGPGTHTREPGAARSADATGRRSDTHDSVVRTTDAGGPGGAGRAERDEVTRAWAARNAATGSSAAVERSDRSDSRGLRVTAARAPEQARVGRVHAAGDEGGDDRLDQVAEDEPVSATTAASTDRWATAIMPTIPTA